MSEIVFRGPGEGRQIISGQMALAGRLPTADLIVKAGELDTGGAYSIFESLVPPGAPGPLPHVHGVAEEAWYILNGSLTFKIGAREFVANEGSFVLAPRGVLHSFSNPGDIPARHLTFFSPPRDVLWRTVTEMREAAGSSPLDVEKMVALYARYGEDARNLGIDR
jgi:mannose-6-phosphate isomerase-like protein (cupin superfamily)